MQTQHDYCGFWSSNSQCSMTFAPLELRRQQQIQPSPGIAAELEGKQVSANKIKKASRMEIENQSKKQHIFHMKVEKFDIRKSGLDYVQRPTLLVLD